ncbi:MAG TPA: FKBP-type peptidyl-prolyl cis-trans isomerase [Pirellulaceae bacterium]|nr:FKBP-type peptidyl-prolyl cis-trans isomerase [Pirellulaceae bacterium]
MLRSLALSSLACLLIVGTLPAQDKPAKEPVAPPAAEKVDPVKLKADYSYAIGLQIGRGIKADDIEVDLDLLVKGFSDALKGGEPALNDAQLRAAMMGLQAQMQTKMVAKAKAEGDKNKKEGEAFLAANKKKPGVTTLPSGLQYKVLTAGAGKSPKATDVVSTHYHGTLINGTVFDSSKERGEPASFPVNRVIPGWTEALQKMKVGDKWELVIPSDLAYGASGSGQDIGPNSVLVFEVELLGIGDQK